MKGIRLWALLLMVLSGCRAVSTSDSLQTPVPPDFRYGESAETVRYEQPLMTSALSGRVLDPSGSGLAKVLVEILHRDWQVREDATFTNADGFFSFAKDRNGETFVKFSKPGFKTVQAKVFVGPKGPPIEVTLPVDR